MSLKKLITIAIPTFNEEIGLNLLLQSIYENLKDSKEQEFKININIGINSGKDPIPYVQNQLNKLEDLKIIKDINIEYRDVNIHFSSNITYLHSSSEEGFMWFISDDDIVLKNSFKYLFTELKKLITLYENSQNVPPLYLNWTSIYKKKETYTSPFLKTLQEFCNHNESIFFISAMIIYKEHNRYMHPFEHFAHLWIFLHQAIKAGKVLYIDKPIIEYTPNCKYKKTWFDIMFYGLPATLQNLKKLGLSDQCVRTITKNSFENSNTFYTAISLAYEQSLYEKLFTISSIFKFGNFYSKKFKLLITLSIIISPFYKKLRFTKKIIYSFFYKNKKI